MFYIWVIIAIIFMILETLSPQYNYLCFALGSVFSLAVQLWFNNFLWAFLVLLFFGIGFILWLKPNIYRYRK